MAHLEFLTALIIVALFQILGGLFAWLVLKKFQKYNRYALLAEMFQMIIVISQLTSEGFSVTGFVVNLYCFHF